MADLDTYIVKLLKFHFKSYAQKFQYRLVLGLGGLGTKGLGLGLDNFYFLISSVNWFYLEHS